MLNHSENTTKTNLCYYTDYYIQIIHLSDNLKSNPWLRDFLFLQFISWNKSDI
jgi:hypothetical protein